VASNTNPNIGIGSLALFSDYKQQLAPCSRSQELYASLHGYDRIVDESVHDTARPPMWSKIVLLRKYLPLYDWFLWLDGDVMVTNYKTKIEQFTSFMSNDKVLLIASVQGHSGWPMLNSGVMLLRNCSVALKFLDKVWKHKPFQQQYFFEQSAIIDILQSTPALNASTILIPHEHSSIFNAVDFRSDAAVHWRPGDWLIHFSGVRATQNGLDDPLAYLAHLQDMYSRLNSSDYAGERRIATFVKELNQVIKDDL
jgi:hypothetical protein